MAFFQHHNNIDRNKHTLSIFLFLLLFLGSIFLFSKRALEPTLSPYSDPNSQGTRVAPQDPTADTVDDNVETAARVEEVPDKTDSVPDSDSKKEDALEENDERVDGERVAGPTETDPVPKDESLSDPDDEKPNLTESQNDAVVSNTDEDSNFAADEFDGGSEKRAESGNEPEKRTGDSNVEASEENGEVEGESAVGLGQQCDLYTGKWVRDDQYPIYKPGTCPYVDEAFGCQDNGRPDTDYLKWRWQPDGCQLPRFNASDFLEKLRGKRLMLVGDSMNRNQFESILCVLRAGLKDKSRMHETHGYKISKGRGYFVFKFVDYDCTVEFVRSHFLVKEGVRINAQGNSNPTLSIDRIDKTSGRWRKADILIFNTAHWWSHGKTARGKNYYKEGNYIYPQFDAVEAYRRAIKTWAKWVDGNVNKKKQLVFYRGYSSAHFRGGDWDSGGTCNGETEPIKEGSAFLNTYPLKMKIVEEVIRDMKVPVILLNVTRLTNFRKDGHPSVYGKKGAKLSLRRQDCSHWCLPGVPDAWNELIYYELLLRQSSKRNT
uniref:Trichome birefringence-like N-terminal domain-containing protein n=1 Tax=Kalanchoe fedtschenkoi TaxID=63787 RepID=A0A7N0R924_KALFE